MARRLTAPALYLLLAAIHLVYLPHAQFVLDDWPVLQRYQDAVAAGPAEALRVVKLLARNEFHGQFRFQWISFTIGYVLFLIVGYAPRMVYGFFLLLHAANAMALRAALQELGIRGSVAFLAGAVFVLLPSTHGPLYWSHNCSFFLWSTFWFLLYLRVAAKGLREERRDWKAAAQQSGLLSVALFSGDPNFGLLLAGAPLAAWYMGKPPWRAGAGLRATLLAWATVGTAAAFYALVVNRAPMVTSGVGLRYEFTPTGFWNNLLVIALTYRKLSGLLPDSYYQLRFAPTAVAAAVISIAATVGYLWRRSERVTAAEAGRTLLLAAVLWGAAYGPIWFIRGHEFRYDYVPSPYLALGIAVVIMMLPARTLLAGVVTGWLALATVANMGQGWIPQSQALRRLAARVREMPIERSDLIIVSNTTKWIGTAPHFVFLAGWASTPFAETVTGVRPLEAAREIVKDQGRLRVYHLNYMRDLKPGETARTRVLVVEKDGQLRARQLLAEEVHAGTYRLHPLKGYEGPPVGQEIYTREQLGLLEGRIYFARRFDSHRAGDW